MNQYKKIKFQLIAKEMVERLKDKGYISYYAEDKEEAKKKILSLIPYSSSISVGGSETLEAMNIIEEFRSEKYKFFDRFKKMPYEEMYELYRQSLLSDYFISSTNTITRNGELVNTDSSGNRVASMIIGPRKVIIVAGANKVVENLEEAFKRIKEIAPMNATRVHHDAPCVKTGRCMKCEIQSSVCNYTGIIENGRKEPGRITIIMVADELGF
ncbi:lactate utilization protein [Clostridium sp. SHJSY1]|uniref:lactate utilization protein n=1 Tax=Clostridium sp. SHJSY1 TaxID=2942483 RepID=UPI00287616AE|nr:lactate utilization protein [Clostridium sp. SHJSY1]MDS0525792.1 lactate utilization protein [Clostridium sp. SHJSY1]